METTIDRVVVMGVAERERAGAEREHAAEAQAAWAIGLHGRGGALLGVECSAGEGELPCPDSLQKIEDGAESVPRFNPVLLEFLLSSIVWTLFPLTVSLMQGEEQRRRYLRDKLRIDQDPPAPHGAPDGGGL